MTRTIVLLAVLAAVALLLLGCAKPEPWREYSDFLREVVKP